MFRMILSGARSNNVSENLIKFYAGVVRACYRTDSVIIDGT